MDSGESLGIYLQTIRTLMNSRIYQQQESNNQNKSELEIQEEEQFLSQLIDSLADLQDKLRREKLEKDNQFEEKREKQLEQMNHLQQEAEILEQQNQELQKVLQNEEEQHIQMTQHLAKSQLNNFQNSKILQKLDNEFYEGNRYKIKTEEVNLQNKLLKEKKLQLLKEEQIYKSQIEDQIQMMKRLHKDHLQIEAQYRMFERKLHKLKKEQDDQIHENQTQRESINSMSKQCRQLIEQNQALMAQRDSLQYQIEEVLADQNIIMSVSHMQSNCYPYNEQENNPHLYNHNNNNNSNSNNNNNNKHSQNQVESIITCLKDELGDQFSDAFFSPLSSVTETERDEQMAQKLIRLNNGQQPHPFVLEEKTNLHPSYYESSGGNTEQSSTNTRSSDVRSSSNQTISLENPIKHLNKVMLASDFYDENQDEIEVQNNQIQQAPSNIYLLNSNYIGSNYFKQKAINLSNQDTPRTLNNTDIKDICSNIISWLTYKPLINLKSSQQLS